MIASRTGGGPLLASTHDGPGSEINLRRSGLIFAGRLHPLKTRLLLELLCAAASIAPASRASSPPVAEGAMAGNTILIAGASGIVGAPPSRGSMRCRAGR